MRLRLDGILIFAVAWCAGALVVGAPLPVGIAAGIVLVTLAVARGRRRPVLALFSAVAFLFGTVRGARVVSRHEEARAPLLRDGAWPARCVLRGLVARSPVQIGDALRIDVDVGEGSCADRGFEGRVMLHVPEASSLRRGDVVQVTAQLAPLHRFWNEGTGDPRAAQARRGVLLSGAAEDLVVVTPGVGIRAWVDRARNAIRRRIQATYPIEAAAMARALVLGEDDLDVADQRAFRRSGLAHLLAVSGMHLVIVIASLVLLARGLLVRIPLLAARCDVTRMAAAMGIPLAWIYADLAGASGSALRAAWMMTVGLLAQVIARRPDGPRALGLSMLGMVLVDPLAPHDVSFGLSTAATGGILAIAPRLQQLLDERVPPWLGIVTRPIATTAAATIACAPLLAGMSGELPLAGLFANVVAVPLGELAALPLCLVHALLSPLPLAERGAAFAGAGALGLVRRIAHAFAGLSWGAAAVPTPTAGQLAALAVGAFGLATRRPRAWGLTALAVVLALERDARIRGAPSGVLRATFLDVGQGDAAIVDLPDGRALLVDGGGLVGSPVDTGERVIAPVLRARRRRALEAIVLSHPHPDHFSGLVTAAGSVRVGALWDTGQGEAEGVGGGYAELLAKLRARGVAVLRPGDLCGAREIGGAIVEVLAPCPSVTADRGPNDNSLVVRIRHGRRAILFAGDAEHEAEHDLLRTTRASLRADVLKVGHHGSRTSTTREWLEAVAPSVAVISCGIRNRFGHPHASTLATLGGAGTRILRTDLDGGVVVTTDGERLDVETSAGALE